MSTVVGYIILIFFAPNSAAPFDLGFGAQSFDTLEECVAAIPDELASEVPVEIEDSVEGAACVTPEMADAIMGMAGAPAQ